MRRRAFLGFVSGAVATWPAVVARAQQSPIPVIGFLNAASPDSYAYLVRAFHQGLSDVGYVEGKNFAIEYRWADGRYDRLPTLAADLVRLNVTLIAANSAAAVAAKAVTSTIPIVFDTGFDPVELGLVASLNRPGGNLTGVSNLNVELGPKRLELAREMVPSATVIALLINPTNPNAKSFLTDYQAAARTFGLELHAIPASSERDFDTVFSALIQLRAGALVVGADTFFISRSKQLATMALHHAVPAIFQYREFAAAGGLMSYGGSLADAYRQVGNYAGRILKGEKPADLPVQQSTKAELIINLKTAKALGIIVPPALIARADEVIE